MLLNYNYFKVSKIQSFLTRKNFGLGYNVLTGLSHNISISINLVVNIANGLTDLWDKPSFGKSSADVLKWRCRHLWVENFPNWLELELESSLGRDLPDTGIRSKHAGLVFWTEQLFSKHRLHLLLLDWVQLENQANIE